MGKIDYKNEVFSKLVSSFGLGPIFWTSLGNDLSRNVSAMLVYAFGKKLPRRKGPGMMPKNDRNFRKSSVSDEHVEFWRPCRGLSPGKGKGKIKKEEIRSFW